ncbi:capsular biosynthesis protein [Pigmentiphaga sp. CHJ604]|uniref:capsular biosynthesis protein n=1 Tax=Pigmentiphaga sp. CHJ604 TaxID=3081984 RepID=UPI0030D52274
MHLPRFARSLLYLGLFLAWEVRGADAPPPALYPFTIDENALSGPPDQSALNAPLDARARLSARNGHFYRAGADGRWDTDDDERVRLFGINLSFGANFPRAEEAPKLARRLRKLGFNAVRLHHLDTSPGTSTDAPASLLTPGPYPTFNEAAVERLRNFIRALAQEGIYVNLNLRVGYRFRHDTDAVPAYAADRMQRPIASPIVVYHPRMVALQERFAEEVISRLGLRNSPSLGMVEINNESSLLAAWQRHEWRDAVPEAYRDLLLEAWRSWVVRRYGSTQAACSAWRDCSNIAEPVELPSQANVQHASSALDVLLEKAGRRARALISNPAPASAVMPPPLRILDFVQFLAEQDRQYLDRIRRTIRRSAGFDVPVTGTQMGYGGQLNLTSHEGMDYLDDHFYVDHPHFLQGSSNIRNWRIWNVSLTGKHMDMLRLSSFRRQAGKPFVVSEFNQPFPSGPAGEVVPLVAAYASLQDWDGLFFFDYGENPSGSLAPSNFGLSGDWGKYVNVGQSARLFRENQLPPLAASTTLPMPVAMQALLTARGVATDGTDPTDGYLAGLYHLSTVDIWQRRIAVSPGLASPLTTAPKQASPPTADYDPRRKVLTLRAPSLMGFYGPTDAPGNQADGLRVVHAPPAPSFAAAVTLSTLDNEPVATSRRWLLTLGTATVGTQPGSIPARPKEQIRHPSGSDSWTLEPDPQQPGSVSGSRNAQPPAWLAAHRMQVSWPSNASWIEVFPLDGEGRRYSTLPPARIRVEGGRAIVDLQHTAVETAPWYEIVATP